MLGGRAKASTPSPSLHNTPLSLFYIEGRGAGGAASLLSVNVDLLGVNGGPLGRDKLNQVVNDIALDDDLVKAGRVLDDRGAAGVLAGTPLGNLLEVQSYTRSHSRR